MADKPEYRVYRSRWGILSRLLYRDRDRFEQREQTKPAAPPAPRPMAPLPRPEEEPERRRISWRRILLWVAIGVVGWLLLSFVLFMISAELQADKVSERTQRALDDGGNMLTTPNNILVLGSDRRPGESGRGRADSIMLLRYGGGKAARLSIPRDTLVSIPGSGSGKINAAYAIGGPALMIRTVREFLDIEVHHIVEVDFKGFPKFVDAMGGVTMSFENCLVSRFEGKTWRYRKGKNHLDGEDALAVVRIRKNRCDRSESDLTRARRQQQFIEAVKGRVLSPFTFPRLPWVAWRAPRAIRSDMGGLSLLALWFDTEVGGAVKPELLEPVDRGANPLVVSEADKQEAVQRFLDG
jgi:LCP family protein required for cell wall assembly